LHSGTNTISTSLRREALGMTAAKGSEFQAEIAFKFRQNHVKALEFKERCIIERSVAELVRRAVSGEDVVSRHRLRANPSTDNGKRENLGVTESEIPPSVNPSIDTSILEDLDETQGVMLPTVAEPQESEHNTDWEGVWSAPPAQLIESSIMDSESFETEEEDLGPRLRSSSELVSPIITPRLRSASELVSPIISSPISYLVTERSPGSRLAAALASQ